MNNPLNLHRPADTILRLLKVGGSGLLSSVLLVVLASGRMPLSDLFNTADFLIFLQWMTFAILIGKAGVDQVLFAEASLGSQGVASLRKFLISRTVPAAIAVGAIVSFVADPLTGVSAFALSLIDVPAVIRLAELNGRGRQGFSAAANLLNMPLFCLVAVLFSALGGLNNASAICLLAGCKVLRLLAANAALRDQEWRPNTEFPPYSNLIFQQAGIFMILRGDQLCLSIFGSYLPAWMSLEKYLFLARLLEISSLSAFAIGSVLFPLIPRFSARHGWSLGRTLLVISSSLVVVWLGIGAGYRYLWSGLPIEMSEVVPFAVAAGLVFSVHFLIYLILGYSGPSLAIRLQLRAAAVALLGTGAVSFWMGAWVPMIFAPVALATILLWRSPELDGLVRQSGIPIASSRQEKQASLL